MDFNPHLHYVEAKKEKPHPLFWATVKKKSACQKNGTNISGDPLNLISEA